jgi:hypothetical protein
MKETIKNQQYYFLDYPNLNAQSCSITRNRVNTETREKLCRITSKTDANYEVSLKPGKRVKSLSGRTKNSRKRNLKKEDNRRHRAYMQGKKKTRMQSTIIVVMGITTIVIRLPACGILLLPI